MYLYQVMMTLHFLNDVANDTESTQKWKITSYFASLKSETERKLINRILDECVLISSLPGKALRTLVDIARLAEPGKLDLKDTHLVFSIYCIREQ